MKLRSYLLKPVAFVASLPFYFHTMYLVNQARNRQVIESHILSEMKIGLDDWTQRFDAMIDKTDEVINHLEETRIDA